MSKLHEEIAKRVETVGVQINRLEAKLRSAPKSRLRISMNKGIPRFYEVKEKNDTTGKYIPKSQMDKVRNLAQADYEKKVLVMLRQEKQFLLQILRFYESFAPKDKEGFFSGPEELLPAAMLPERRALIEPITCDRQTFIKNWLTGTYEKKGFADDAPEYYTGSGIRVRSKTEWMIVEMLEKKNIPFYYERPLILDGMGTVHPDFTVLNIKSRKTMYWEHLGMMDDEFYRGKAMKKIEAYMRTGLFPGVDLILTHETSERPVRSQLLERIIEVYLLR